MTDAKGVLGVADGATEEEIRAAYLRAVREHPPDTSPEQFERIRDAYEALRDPRSRARNLLFSGDPLAPLDSLIAGRPAERRYAGPDLWLAALKGSIEK